MISSFFLSQRKIAQNSGFFTPSQNTWKQSPARITAHTPLLPASSPPPPGSFFLVVVFACDKDQTILVMVKQLWAREERKKSIAVSSFFVANERAIFFLWRFADDSSVFCSYVPLHYYSFSASVVVVVVVVADVLFHLTAFSLLLPRNVVGFLLWNSICIFYGHV